MLLLSEFFFFQCIGIRNLRGLVRPLNVIESSYNFAGFISMSITVVHNLFRPGATSRVLKLFGGQTGLTTKPMSHDCMPTLRRMMCAVKEHEVNGESY